jgi:succinate dehydrogenase/fumarate reductase flavoprotein subunit
MGTSEAQIATSVLVTGTGGSGLRAAIELAERGIDVLAVALERRESRGCHNRADYPELDPSLQVNFVWSGPGQLRREPIPAIPSEIAGLMHDVSADGKLVE